MRINNKENFDFFQLKIASPEKIRSWSARKISNAKYSGQVKSADTIHFNTKLPINKGLFCQKIFGPVKSWKCQCGKYSGFLLNKVCEICNTEITDSRVRRYRMSFIDLKVPVAHYWYYRTKPNYLQLFLQTIKEEIKASTLIRLINYKEDFNVIELLYFFSNFLFSIPQSLDVLKNYIIFKQFLMAKNSFELINFSDDDLEINTFAFRRKGADIIKSALESIILEQEINIFREEIKSSVKLTDKEKRQLKILRILESFLATKMRPEWMILTTLPILPPGLRPIMELDSGNLIISDITELYRIIVLRNNRLNFVTPYSEIQLNYNASLLQSGIDCLIDNAKIEKEFQLTLNNRPLKSLTENLEGKEGRFRLFLLGKRLDYSARSVIVVGPHLKLNECGLPYDIAKILYKPFLFKEIFDLFKLAGVKNISNILKKNKIARLFVEGNMPFLWSLLKKILKNSSIILNRAPTLHKFGMQSFNPLLVSYETIFLHPLVCTGFNADFDGDQMAVHLPLVHSTQYEAQTLMRPYQNILSPSNGDVILKPTQDMVIGCFYLTLNHEKRISNIFYNNETEAIQDYLKKYISLHSPILINYSIKNFSFYLKNNQLFIKNKFLDLFDAQIIKINQEFILDLTNTLQKIVLITNIGIIILDKSSVNTKYFLLSKIFFNTTPGNIILKHNLTNSIKLIDIYQN